MICLMFILILFLIYFVAMICLICILILFLILCWVILKTINITIIGWTRGLKTKGFNGLKHWCYRLVLWHLGLGHEEGVEFAAVAARHHDVEGLLVLEDLRDSEHVSAATHALLING